MKAITYNRSAITAYAWHLSKKGMEWAEAMATAWDTYKRQLLKRLLRGRGRIAFTFIKKSTGLERFAIGSTKKVILEECDALSNNPNYQVPMTGIEGSQNFYDHTIGEWRKFNWNTLNKILYIV